MSRRSSGSKLPQIAASTADSIFRSLVPLAEQGYALSDRLVGLGWSAHVVWQRFLESFAATENELAQYRKYRLELARNNVGQSWRWVRFDPSNTYFSSDYIAGLIEQRDVENGVTIDELSSRYPAQEMLWRKELTACDRRRVQLEMYRREEYESLYQATVEASKLALAREADRFSAIAASLADPLDWLACYAACMQRYAAPLGFHLDERKSTGVVPIFSKEVAEGWDLCWSMETPLFIGSPTGGLFGPALQLRSRKLRGSTKELPYYNYLEFNYTAVVPDFKAGYHGFTDVASLETIIIAHLTVYEWISVALEGAIRQRLLH